MSESHKAHKAFLKVLKDKSLGKNSDLWRVRINALLSNKYGNFGKSLNGYLKWLMEMSEENYYLNSPHSGVFLLVSRELKSAVTFRYCTELTEATKRILKGYYEAIEIINLHSLEKGQGKKIMKEFINLSQKLRLPLTLYAENDELVEYYLQYGFVNHGKLGEKNEYLLLRTI